MKTVAVALESQHFGFGQPTSETREILRRKRAGRPLASSSSWHRCGCGFQSDQCLSWKVAIDKHIKYIKYIKHMTSKQQFPDISSVLACSTRVVFAEAERWAKKKRHPTSSDIFLSGTWSRMGLKRWTYATFCIRLAEFAADFAAECFTLHSFNMFQYISNNKWNMERKFVYQNGCQHHADRQLDLGIPAERSSKWSSKTPTDLVMRSWGIPPPMK